MPAPPKPSPAPVAVGGVMATCAAAWIVPGAGHMMRGQWRKGATFFAVLLLMDAIGLACGGRLFPFQLGEPLVLLAAAAEWALAAPRIIAGVAGLGQGNVVAASYEYGNTFLIVAGLLNALIVLDASDLARGRKAA